TFAQGACLSLDKRDSFWRKLSERICAAIEMCLPCWLIRVQAQKVARPSRLRVSAASRRQTLKRDSDDNCSWHRDGAETRRRGRPRYKCVGFSARPAFP